MAELPVKATRAEFARIANRDPAWISRLEASGRVVVDPVDDMILVAESLELIAATAAGRVDVADRHQREREARAESPAQDNVDAAHRRARAAAELRLKQAEADRAELARDREAAELMEVDEARRAMLDLATIARVEVEQIAERVAPLIAAHALDIPAITGVIAAEADACLHRISDALRRHADALPKPISR